MELIRLEDIYKTYYLGEVDVPVLRGISLTIQRGEMVALMGASGSGKTTLMNILGCLDRPTAGRFWLDGQEMSALTPNQRALVRTEKLGFVFQSFNLLPRTTALHNVIMPLDYAVRRSPSAAARQLAESLLGRVGLADRMHHESSQMSGGQQQRVAIARSLVNHPVLILADEPTGNLDSHMSVEILRMFQQLNAEGITVLLVTHDPNVAAYAHRTIHITDGMVDGDETHNPRTDPHEAGQARIDRSGRVPGPRVDGDGNGGPGRELAAVGRVDRKAATGGREPNKAATGGRAAATKAAVLNRMDAAVAVEQEPVAQPAPVNLPAPRGHGWSVGGLLPTTWRTALGALRRNKMRSALTALGVVIGIAAVIAVTEFGQGSKALLQRTIASMGANNLLVLPGAAASSGVSWGMGSSQTLSPDDLDEIGRQCPAVTEVAPVVRGRGQLVYGSRNWNTTNVIGTTADYLGVRDWEEMEEGDIFSDRDVRNRSKVCVIGMTLKRELFQDESPIGKEMRVQNVSFRVIGVLSRKGANMMGMDQDDIVLAPWTTIKFFVSGASANAVQATAAAASSDPNALDNLYTDVDPLYPTLSTTEQADTPQFIRFVTVDQIMAKAASAQQIPQAMEQITGLLHERHHIQPSQDDDFNIRDMTEMTKMLSQTSNVMSMTLLIVAFVSLVVGGVGIMNIMLVSVTERTREIGLRMAVGARSHHILRQFLVEAVVLCLAGGAIGIALGRFFSLLMRNFMRWPTEASLPVIVLAVAVSVGVGVVFGFYPAWKASRLDPIEALRYE